MSSKRKMYFKLGNTFQFPVLPEQISVSYGSNNDKLNVCGIGEVTVIQSSQEAEIQFTSFFPRKYFAGCNYKKIPKPKEAYQTILKMRDKGKPIRFTLTGGIGISLYCTIEQFEISEKGGDPETIYFSIKLKEFRKVAVRKLNVTPSKKLKVGFKHGRISNKVKPKTYTVKNGDCLWMIAKKIYGDGSKYTKLYDANKKIIGSNPNKLKVGITLTIP